MRRAEPLRATGKLRIVGGSLRGSKLAVPELPGLRPTPDRVRETLFNWLMPVIEGARCLDLYAGTGALGIEALSRGAAWVDFVEADARLAKALRDNLARLHQDNAAVRTADAARVLAVVPSDPYDVVFVDPPFAASLWDETVAALAVPGWLRDGAFVHVEMPADARASVPAHWQLHREARAGALRYALYRCPDASAKL
jgi:16S rRNA (guanine966-N2)-methyltransferase